MSFSRLNFILLKSGRYGTAVHSENKKKELPLSVEVDKVLRRSIRIHEHPAETRVSRRRDLKLTPDLVVLVGTWFLRLEDLYRLERVGVIGVDVFTIDPGKRTDGSYRLFQWQILLLADPCTWSQDVCVGVFHPWMRAHREVQRDATEWSDALFCFRACRSLPSR